MTREMTREEARNLLKNSKPKGSNAYSLMLNDALDMAIEVLKQEDILDKIRDEIEQIEINGHIRDVECFSAGIDTVLKIIDKYRAESEE